MKKRFAILSFTLVLAMLLSTAAGAWSKPKNIFRGFQDIPSGHWATDDIRWCTDYGVMAYGSSKKLFQPEDSLTRAMFVKICSNLVTQIGYDTTYSEVKDYPDVAQNAWFYDSVQWASENGIVGGHANGTFTPDAPITRAQMAQMMYNFITRYCGAELDDDTAVLEKTYKDAAQIPQWARPAVAAMTNSKLLNGADGKFCSDATATRAQAAAISHRLQQYYNNSPSCFTGNDLTLVWNDEFEGTELDTTKWKYGSCGNLTAFGEEFSDPAYVLQYQKDHIKVQDGNLVMNVEYMDNSAVDDASENFVGDQNVSVVWVDTADKYYQTYGYYEIRCILGTGSGSNCAFWMGAGKAWDPSSQSSRDGAEIDVFESVYTSNNHWGRPILDSTIHWQHNAKDEEGASLHGSDHCYFYAEPSRQYTRDGKYLPTSMFDGNYHTIGVLWTKEEYVFYYDGYEMYRTDCKDPDQPGAQGTCEAPAWLLLSCHFMDPDWYGVSKPEDYPLDFVVDYVRCYQLTDYMD